MNIFGGASNIFAGIGIDGQEVAPQPGVSVFRVNYQTGLLQLSNNGSAFGDVAIATPAASIVAGTNISVTTDISGNWVISTVASPSFTNITASGTLTANRIVATDSTNTANIIMSTLTNSGTADPEFRIRAARGDVTNATGSIVGRLGLYYGTQPNAYINFHRGDLGTNGFMDLHVAGVSRLLLDNNGASTLRGAFRVCPITEAVASTSTIIQNHPTPASVTASVTFSALDTGGVQTTLFGNGDHVTRSRINGTANQTVVTIGNTGVQWNYFRLTSTSIDQPGCMRYNGGVIQFYDGTQWRTLTFVN